MHTLPQRRPARRVRRGNSFFGFGALGAVLLLLGCGGRTSVNAALCERCDVAGGAPASTAAGGRGAFALGGAPGFGGTTQTTSSGGQATTTPGSGGVTGGAPATSDPLPDALGCKGTTLPAQSSAACTGFTSECEALSFDTYLLVERSAKMAEPWGGSSRFQIVRDAASQWLHGPGGLAFVGLPANDLRDRCAASNYAKPAFIGDLGASALIASAFDGSAPSGKNPLLPALQGLLSFVETRSAQSPNRWQRVILVTASAPNECPASVRADDVGTLIRDFLSRNPARDVLVIELGADFDPSPLSRAADTLPYRIDSQGAPARLREALLALTTGCFFPPKLSCRQPRLEIPPAPEGRELDLSQISIQVETVDGSESIPQLAGASACGASPNGGFYLIGRSPPEIEFCPCSCGRLAFGEMSLSVACTP